MRYLLSVVGAFVFEFLDPYSVEVWRIRAVARTFGHGVASAYEKAVGAQGMREVNLVNRQPEPESSTWMRYGMFCLRGRNGALARGAALPRWG